MSLRSATAILRREPGLAHHPWSFGAGLCLPALLAALWLGSPLNEPSVAAQPHDLLAVLIAASTIGGALIGWGRGLPVPERVKPHEYALPVSLRGIVLQRVFVAWLAWIAPLFLCTLLILWWMPLGEAPAEVARAALLELAQVVLLAALTVTAAAVAPFCVQPRRARLSAAASTLAVVLGMPLLFLPIYFGAGAGLLGGLVAVQLAWLLARLPSDGPTERPMIRAPGRQAAHASIGVRAFGPLRWAILRRTLLNPGLAAAVLVAAALAVFAGDVEVVALPMVAIGLCGGILRDALDTLHGTDHLPVDRARLVRLVSLPMLVVLAAAFVGRALVGPRPDEFSPVRHVVALDGASDRTLDGEESYRDHVRVPAHRWRVVTSVEEAHVRAPWGESVAPTPHRLLPGVSLFAYNPYDVEPRSSGRLLTWQVARALRDVHGWRGTAEDLHARWLAGVDLDAPVEDLRLKQVDAGAWGFTPIDRTDGSGRIGFAALAAVLAWIVVAGFVLRPNVPSLRARIRAPRGAIDGAIVFGLLFAIWGFGRFSLRYDAVVPVALAQLRLALDRALGSSPLAWAGLVVGLAVLGTWLLSRRIRRIEVPLRSRSAWSRARAGAR